MFSSFHPIRRTAAALIVLAGASALLAAPVLTHAAPLASALRALVGSRVAYTSTQSGAWNSAATWGGTGVPGASDDVTIAAGHTIDVTPGAAARSLTIGAGATLRRYSGPDGLYVLPVAGGVVNRGAIIAGHPADPGTDRLALSIGGDVVNEGTWDAVYTALNGTSAQSLTLAGAGLTTGLGNLWADETPASALVAGSDLFFRGRVELRGSTLDMGARRLRLTGGDILDGGRAADAGGIVRFAGGVLDSGPDFSVWNARIEGAVTLEGSMQVGNSLTASGPVTVADQATLRRVLGPDGLWTLDVSGAFTNRGTIVAGHPGDAGTDRLALRIGVDITNAGTWGPVETALTGTGSQTVTLAAGASLNGTWVDETPASAVVAVSDLRFLSRVELRGSRLEMGAYRLTLDGNADLDGALTGAPNGTIGFAGGTIDSRTDYRISNVRLDGALTLDGLTQVGLGVVASGPLTLATGATLRRLFGTDGLWTMTVEGAFTNRGTIVAGHPADPGTDRLALRIGGDIVNEGTWTPAETRVVGTAAQRITLAGAGLTSGFGNLWVDETPTSGLVAGSDLRFLSRVELRGSRLDMGANRLVLDGNADLTGALTGAPNATVAFSGGTLETLNDYRISDVRVEGAATLSGLVQVGLGVVASGPLTLASGAMLRRLLGPDGLWTMTVEGAFTNRGTIVAGHPADPGTDRLALRIGGDITNAGTWTPAETYVSGTAPRAVRAEGDVAFGGTWYVDAPGSDLVAGSDLRWSGPLRLGTGTLRMGNQTLTLANGGPTRVETGRIVFGSGTLRGTGTGGATLSDIRIDGPVTLDGTIHPATGIVFGGPLVIAPSTLVERAGGTDGLWTIRVDGLLTNRGDVRPNFPGDPGTDRLGFDLGGSFVNEGIWNPSSTRLVGPAYHDVLMQRAFTAAVTLEDPATTRFGHVLYRRDLTPGIQTYDAVAAGFTVDGSGELDSLTVEAYGDRAPATYGNAVRGQWELRPSPAAVRGSLLSLTLRYRDDGLGANDEALLQVYHSDDGAQTWQQVSTSANLTRNAAANTVTLTTAPAYGTYVLSSRADPVSVRPNVVFSVVGPDRIRVGPPNQYLLTYLNAGPAPTGEFLAGLTTTAGIYIERVIPSATTAGLAPRPLLPDNFSPDGDSTHAVFYVPSLAPGEERTMTAILRTRADIQSPLTSGAAGRAGAGPAIAFGGSVVGGALTGAPASYLKDVWKATLVELVEDPEQAQLAPERAFNRVNEEWRNGAEKGAGEIEGAMQGELAGLAGAGTALDRANAVKEIADFIQELVDANARREERWRRAAEGAPLGPNGGPFADRRIRFPQPDLPAAPPKMPTPVRSWDPNEKYGPQGVGAAGFVTDLGRVTYQIKFENLASASAAAYEVVVVDTLSAAFDPETVVFGPTSFPGFVMTRVGRVLTWRGEGIELPPNQTPPEGEGFVQFSVETVPGLPDGALVANRARIVFDINPPIFTNTHVNTIDMTAPTTAMTALPPQTGTRAVTVGWTAADVSGGSPGSGVDRTTVFASHNGGPFVSVGTTEGTQFVVDSLANGTYAFYALATDRVGNAENVRPAVVSTTVAVAGEEAPDGPVFALAPPSPNPSRGPLAVRYSLAEAGAARVEVFDVLGRLVAVLADGEGQAGRHEVRWNAGTVASGVYIVRLRQGDREQVRQITVVR